MALERAAVSARQRTEWELFRKTRLEPCLASGDEGEARYIKALADTLRIAQDGERRAMLFGEGLEDDGPAEVEWGA